MYKTKPCSRVRMPPVDGRLRVLVLNASLKHEPEVSNTGELSELVLANLAPPMGQRAKFSGSPTVDLPVGLGYRESSEDDWPAIVAKIKAADIVLFATPVWWGDGRA